MVLFLLRRTKVFRNDGNRKVVVTTSVKVVFNVTVYFISFLLFFKSDLNWRYKINVYLKLNGENRTAIRLDVKQPTTIFTPVLPQIKSVFKPGSSLPGVKYLVRLSTNPLGLFSIDFGSNLIDSGMSTTRGFSGLVAAVGVFFLIGSLLSPSLESAAAGGSTVSLVRKLSIKD